MKHVRRISRYPRPHRAQEFTPLEQLLLVLTKGSALKWL
jgi:hypothetical protein